MNWKVWINTANIGSWTFSAVRGFLQYRMGDQCPGDAELLTEILKR